jgi:hypothetical protein
MFRTLKIKATPANPHDERAGHPPIRVDPWQEILI